MAGDANLGSDLCFSLALASASLRLQGHAIVCDCVVNVDLSLLEKNDLGILARVAGSFRKRWPSEISAPAGNQLVV